MSHEAMESVRIRAIEWYIRLRDGDDVTWEAFVAWLAEDRCHAVAHDAVETGDHAIESLLPQVIIHESANDGDDAFASDERETRGGWRKWRVGSAISAEVAGRSVKLAPSGDAGSFRGRLPWRCPEAPGHLIRVGRREESRMLFSSGSEEMFQEIVFCR